MEANIRYTRTLAKIFITLNLQIMKKSLIIIGVISSLVLSGCGQESSNDDDLNTQNTVTNKLENCESWFNGCNTCYVENGIISGCTERYCLPDQYKEAKCTKYKE